jgi:hypothetical protein
LGEIVEGRLTVNALRTCTVKSACLTLACWDTDPRNELRLSCDGWLFKSVQTFDLDRLLAAGQSQSVAFALPMPQPGEMPSYVCQATSAFGPPLCIINCYLQLVSRQDWSFPLSASPFRLIASTPAAALLGLFAIP